LTGSLIHARVSLYKVKLYKMGGAAA